MSSLQPSNSTLLTVLSAVCLLWTAGCLLQAFTALRRLTLRAAWYWCLPALFSLMGLLAADLCAAERYVAPLSFLAAALWLAPLTVSLGARRPGCRVWSWFVVLPMIAVLMWPVIWQLWQNRGRAPVELGTPAAIGFFLVLLMGYGNYFGTGHTLAATLIAAGITLLALPAISPEAGARRLHLLAPCAFAAAGSLILRRQRRLADLPRNGRIQTAQRIWLLFRDSFGILWATRVMDRMNVFAEREHWGITLTLDGFTVDESAEIAATGQFDPGRQHTDEEQFARPLVVLCWLLERFADPEWLAEHSVSCGTSVAAAEQGVSRTE